MSNETQWVGFVDALPSKPARRSGSRIKNAVGGNTSAHAKVET
jgi:hypothetical protein